MFGGRGAAGRASGNPFSLSESIVGMYRPTPGDLALRAAAAGLIASVLGRVKEFTTLSAQAGLLRFDTEGFVSAVARSSSAKGDASGGGGGGGDGGNAARTKPNYESNASSGISVDGAGGSGAASPTVVRGGGGGGDEDGSVEASGRHIGKPERDFGRDGGGTDGGREGWERADGGWDSGGGAGDRRGQSTVPGEWWLLAALPDGQGRRLSRKKGWV